MEEYWRATGSPEVDKGRFGLTKDPVRVMGRVQLGITLPDAEIGEIVAFIEALTGTLPASFATAPALPSAAVKRAP